MKGCFFVLFINMDIVRKIILEELLNLTEAKMTGFPMLDDIDMLRSQRSDLKNEKRKLELFKNNIEGTLYGTDSAALKKLGLIHQHINDYYNN